MRKRQTFLLTILAPETGEAPFCGRVKVIATGRTCTFTSLEELEQMIANEMSENSIRPLINGKQPSACTEETFRAD